MKLFSKDKLKYLPFNYQYFEIESQKAIHYKKIENQQIITIKRLLYKQICKMKKW